MRFYAKEYIVYCSYWDVSDKATLSPSFTCHDEQADGSCGTVHIPDCVDRTVRCADLPNPNRVQRPENNGCEDCPAEMVTIGNPPNINDYRELNTEIQ